MTREDFKRFLALDIDPSVIGMEQEREFQPYFCTPVGAEQIGALGVDGIHFVLLSGDERIFCVDPSMGEVGSYVLPVASDFRTFLSYLLYCKDANVLSQIYWMNEQQYRDLLTEDESAVWPGSEEFHTQKRQVLTTIQEAFDIMPREPFAEVKALQAAFDPSILRFSAEYYDVLGLEETESCGFEEVDFHSEER